MNLSIEEVKKNPEFEECSIVSISFDKKSIPTQILTKIFGEVPAGIYEMIEKSVDQDTITIEVRCYNTSYCNSGGCYPGSVYCYYPSGNCYGPFLGSC